MRGSSRVEISAEVKARCLDIDDGLPALKDQQPVRGRHHPPEFPRFIFARKPRPEPRPGLAEGYRKQAVIGARAEHTKVHSCACRKHSRALACGKKSPLGAMNSEAFKVRFCGQWDGRSRAL